MADDGLVFFAWTHTTNCPSLSTPTRDVPLYFLKPGRDKVLFCPPLNTTLQSTALFHDSPACPSDTSITTKINMEHW